MVLEIVFARCITEYPIIGFASVIKSQADRPPTVKVFSKKNILSSE